FIGFDTVAQMSEEFKVDSKKASFSALVAVIFGGIVYNILNIYTAFGVSSNDLENATWATGQAVSQILGSFALGILAIAMFGAVISGLNGFFMGASRLLFAIIKNEYKDSETSISVNYLVVIVGCLSCIVPFFGRNALIWFVDLSSVGASFAYFITCMAAFKLASTLKYKIYAVLGTLCSLLFLIFLLTPWFDSNIPFVSAICLFVWLGVGIVAYYKLHLSSSRKGIAV
ncbi:amino acid permease, partial [Photobacterium sanctipauli]